MRSTRQSAQHSLLDYWIEGLAPAPWQAAAGSGGRSAPSDGRSGLYTRDERARRDASPWTTVQAILAPAQFAVFLVSLALVVHFLISGEGYGWATASVVLKTLVLYLIMVTGAIWEKDVFGQYLFAPAFFWEDVVSMLVLALHTAYLYALVIGWGSPAEQMVLALAAYVTYVVNAAQFVWKLRIARLEGAGKGVPA